LRRRLPDVAFPDSRIETGRGRFFLPNKISTTRKSGERRMKITSNALMNSIRRSGAAGRWILAFSLGLLALAGSGKATAASTPLSHGSAEFIQSNDPIYIYLFWGEGCPHCAKAKPYLESLAQRNPRAVLRAYEIYYHPENQAVFEAVCTAAGFEPRYVPTILIGRWHWEGWNEPVAQEIEAAVSACRVSGCPDAGAGIVSPLPTVPPTAVPTVTPRPAGPASDDPADLPAGAVHLPLIGAVNLSGQSLPVSTFLIALVDGVNPCSVWVLTMLLALTLHTGSRRKVLAIGAIFLTVTAAIYALFIAGLFTMFTVLSFTGWIQAAVSLVALVFGLVNVKDYFYYQEGPSFTISESKKPGIFQRMRTLMDPDLSFLSLAGGTVVLAAGVSLVEFSCTAGFPVLWTNLMASQNVGAPAFLLLLLLYLVIYQADEMAIFGAAVYSLRASRLEEKHGRILKLVGGMLMLTLAAVMLVRPDLMNDIGSSLLIFGFALAAVLLVLLAHRVILPRLGVRIGSELSPKRLRHSSRRSNRRGKKG
jgi:thiol-disulfide isomerase/thioredoxin